MILGIETSNPSAAGACCGVALGTPGPAGHVQILRVEPLHSHAATARQIGQAARGGLDDDLMPAIDRLFRGASVGPSDLALVGVSAGPGGYTGLRVACAVAAMVAEAAECACVAVPSGLAAVLASAASDGGIEGHQRVGVLLASKGEEAWCEVYRFTERQPGWVLDDSIGVGLLRAEGLAALCEAGVGLLLGDQFVPSSIRTEAGRRGLRVASSVFDPGAVVRAAALGERIDPAKLVPRYPREPDAVTLWRERHAR